MSQPRRTPWLLGATACRAACCSACLAATLAACERRAEEPRARAESASAPESTPASASALPARDTLPYRILAPDSGTVWREGETHSIRWTTRRPGPVNVGVAMGGKDRGHLAMGLAAGIDSLGWRIPPGFVTSYGPARSDAMRIRVEDAADPRIGVESAPFTIAGDTAARR